MTEQHTNKDRILDALLRIIASRGAEALTIRKVASEAGVSLGAIQHHYPTKNRLVVAAMTEVTERFRRRVAARLEVVTSEEERLRIFCRELACIEGDELADGIVWVAFVARASTETEVRAIHAADWARTEEVLLRLLVAAFPDDDLAADDAALLLAVLDGIAVARATEQSDRMTSERAELLIAATLRGLRRVG